MDMLLTKAFKSKIVKKKEPTAFRFTTVAKSTNKNGIASQTSHICACLKRSVYKMGNIKQYEIKTRKNSIRNMS